MQRLSIRDVFEVDPVLKVSEEENGVVESWSRCKFASEVHNSTPVMLAKFVRRLGKWKHWHASPLMVSMLHSKDPLFKAVLPRLFQIGFKSAQSFEFERTIALVQGTGHENGTPVGNSLITVHVIIYIRIEVSTALAQK